MDLPHYRWAARTDTTYGQLAERVGLPEDLVLEVSAALGSPRRSPEDPVREDDATVFELIRTAAAFLDRGALVRTSRVYAEAMGLSFREAVDLTGYTRLTEERGDAAGAGIAAELVEMVDAVATEAGGEIVKWLGDGVMVRFRDPGEAVGAVLEVVARAPRIGVATHAGIGAGAAVLQDGDYFGRTVNLAARVASVAAPGQTLLTDEVVEAASGRGSRCRPMGTVELKGFGEPVRLFEAVAREAADRPRPR
jgi:class 3 adenylate cyclase